MSYDLACRLCLPTRKQQLLQGDYILAFSQVQDSCNGCSVITSIDAYGPSYHLKLWVEIIDVALASSFYGKSTLQRSFVSIQNRSMLSTLLIIFQENNSTHQLKKYHLAMAVKASCIKNIITSMLELLQKRTKELELW